MTPVEPQLPALWCGAEHPMLPGVLCRLLSGHWPASLHDDGEGNRWGEAP